MTATGAPEVVEAVTIKIDESYKLWETGRMPSPDARDFVVIANRVLLEMVPDYHGSLLKGGDYQEQKVADALYEEMQSGLGTSREIAEWLINDLTG